MAGLKGTGDAFVFDPEAARKRIIGDILPEHAQVHLPAGTLCTLLAPSRIAFLYGFIEALAERVTVLLAPSQRLLSRAREVPPVLSWESPRTTDWPQSPRAPRVQEFSPEDPICTVLTSGSTGEPEHFDKNARQLFGEAYIWVNLLGLSASSTILTTTAFHHVYGLLFGVLAPFFANARIVALPENEPSAFHPLKIARCSETHQVSHLITVPTHLRALLEAPIELPSLKLVVCSAAPLEPRDAQAFEDKFGAPVVDVLGSTETGGIASRRPSQSSVWNPLPGVTARLNTQKKLAISSPFLNSPGENWQTEEKATINPDGSFEYLGRADAIVKVGGKRISLKEIEHFTRMLPAVSDCVALSRPAPSLRGQEILLVVESQGAAGQGVEKEAIRKALRQHLERAFVPRKIRIVTRLPRDDRGKLKRDDLLPLFEQDTDLQKTPMNESPPPVGSESIIQLAEDSPRFSGHFAGDPLYPALAQLTDIILPAIRKTFGGRSLAELTRVKWTRSLRPGENVSLRLSPKERGVRFELRVNEELACSGTARLELSEE